SRPLHTSSTGPCPPTHTRCTPSQLWMPARQAPTPFMPGPHGPPRSKPSSICPSQTLSVPSQATSVEGATAPRQAPQTPPVLQPASPVWHAPTQVHWPAGAPPHAVGSPARVQPAVFGGKQATPKPSTTPSQSLSRPSHSSATGCVPPSQTVFL